MHHAAAFASLLAVILAACSRETAPPTPAASGFELRTAEAGLVAEPDLSQVTETISGAMPDAAACNSARSEARQAIGAGHSSLAVTAAARAREACPEALWRAFVPEACDATGYGCADLQR